LTISLAIVMILNKSSDKLCNTVGVASKSIFFLRTLNMDMLSCHVRVKNTTIKGKVKANLHHDGV